jgi:hypothetical protein
MSNLCEFLGIPEDENNRVCVKCNESKHSSEFRTLNNTGSYQRTECKKCAYELGKVSKKNRLFNPDPGKSYVCPICLSDYDTAKGRGGLKLKSAWVADHDHVTDKHRGYLCHKCNRSIGSLGLNDLSRAVKYLEEHNARSI